MNEKPDYFPEIWTLRKNGKPGESFLVCARRLLTPEPGKQVQGGCVHEWLCHPVALRVNPGPFLVCIKLMDSSGEWDRYGLGDSKMPREVFAMGLTRRTAEAALHEAYKYTKITINPRYTRQGAEIHAIIESDPVKAIAYKEGTIPRNIAAWLNWDR
jgi:hypothetical protein